MADINELNNFNPYIIAVRYFDGTKYEQGQIFPERNIYDYELEYIVEGNGYMIIDNRRYAAQPGTLFCRKPGQKNTGIMQYKCYLIPFDIWGNSNNTIDSFTVTEKEYQPVSESSIIPPEASRIYYRDRIEDLFRSIYNEYLNDNPYKQLLLKSYFYQILSEAYLSGQKTKKNNTNINIPVTVQTKLDKCIKFININFKSNLSIESIADIAGLSTSHLYRVFKIATGFSPIQYILNMKIMEAKRLLTQTDMSIKEICYECGFNDPEYFSRIFKQKTDLSPLEFKKTHMVNF